MTKKEGGGVQGDPIRKKVLSLSIAQYTYIHSITSQSDELTRGPPELVQHFRL